MRQAYFKNYKPKNEQEAVDLQLILAYLERNDDGLERSNLAAHVTSSAFVVNPELTRIVFAYHRIYDSWAWVGGHNDGNPNLLEVAIKEAKEETGLNTIVPYSEDIFTVDVIYVKNHKKNGMYVPDHLHLNAAFLLVANESETLAICPEENTGVRWFDIDEVMDNISEDRMRPIYQKAFQLIQLLKEQSKE